MLNFQRQLSASQLLVEKRKDYRNVVLVQVIIIISGFLLSGFLESEGIGQKLVISIFSFFGLVYAFLLWDLLRNFTGSRFLITTFFVVLTLLVLFGFLTEFPFYRVIELPDRKAFFIVFHAVLFPIEATIIGFAIRDLFSGNEKLHDNKLWGAACVYLMIGITFGSIYDFINVAVPGSFGTPIPEGWLSYTESIYYSFNILGGLEPTYVPSNKLVRNLGVLQAVWANLYAILIIGKLFTLPRK